MTTVARAAKQLAQKLTRNAYNTGRKIIKAQLRKEAQIELGKTVVVTEKDGVKSYDFAPTPKIQEPPTPPRLSWLGGKQYPQQGDSRRNRSHHGPEHREAFVENASRIFTAEVTKALEPPPIVEPATVPAPEVSEVTEQQ